MAIATKSVTLTISKEERKRRKEKEREGKEGRKEGKKERKERKESLTFLFHEWKTTTNVKT